MSLKWPILLLILLLPVMILIWRRFKKPKIKPIFVSETSSLKDLPSYKKATSKIKLFRRAEIALLTILIASFAILASRPLTPSTSYSIEKSRDIVLLLDVSGSMKEMIPPMINTAEEVIKNNPTERYSIVTFAGVANTVLPLTRDPVAIQESIELLRQVYEHGNDPNYAFQELNGGGTDIGEGVLNAVNRFDNLETYKSRSIILLSDLEQGGGNLDPNSEFHLEKISLIPKYKINFFILKAPSMFSFSASQEIASYGGAKVYDVDKDNAKDSVSKLSAEIFDQILNSRQSVGKNLVDNPSPLILGIIILSIALITLRFVRWIKL